jgi:hypothetical protein
MRIWELEERDRTTPRWHCPSIRALRGDIVPQAITYRRWSDYQSLFRELELPNGFTKAGSQIQLPYDQASVWNGDSTKGFVYSVEPLPACKSDLSICEPKSSGAYGTMVYKLIKPHWYLWLHYAG